MTDAIAHRGPDDCGHWCDENSQVGLGHRRLSIIDVSPLGHQPMGSRSGRYQIVFNGEIYNFETLRRDLLTRGDTFRGRSDTEVLLAAIERWGLAHALQRAVGMFALALWDREARTLSLARDRLGEKPLYYGIAGGSLLFGSELKALRAHPAWRGDIDRGAIALFLRHNYIPAPYSIYENVRKVVPGTIVTFGRPRLDAASTETYWSARDAVENGTRDPMEVDERELIDRCEQRLKETIADEMISDVPLGAFLSGGVDSSLIVALMQAQSSRPVKTFTIGFHVKEYDEAQHAKAVAAHLGTEHTELYVTPQETMDVIPSLPQLYDEPFADASQVPTFLVAKLARQHVTVSLSGDGGDELFGGYYRYFWSKRLWSGIRYIPPSLRRGLSRGIRAVSPSRWDRIMATAHRALPSGAKMSIPGDRMHKLAGVLAVDTADDMYHELVSHWREPRAVALGAQERATALTDRASWPALEEFVERMMYLDLVTYLPDDILVKVDRASMGVSLESRAPFLDHRVVEFAWRVPLRYKVRDGEGKWLLRQVLYRHVPRALIERPKMGFGIPIDRWLRGELRDWAEDLLSERRLRDGGFFAVDAVREKWAEHQSGARNWQYLLWDVIMFQAWHRAQQ